MAAPGAGPSARFATAQTIVPRTLDLLGRAVHMDISPLLTNEDIEETLDGLSTVLG